jgi:hypothetical protein
VFRKLIAFAIVGFVLFGTSSAWAHEHRDVGAVSLVVGWLNEPTYSGSVNAVSVGVTKGGSPVADAKLSVVVLFGKKDSLTKSGTSTLSGSDETPGEYTAPIIPSRPGTYTFHITGDAGGTKVDQFFTSSETTFDDVKDATADEFPAKDPTTGQLAQRLDASDAKVKSVQSKANLALIALIVAIAGLVVAFVGMTRRGR